MTIPLEPEAALEAALALLCGRRFRILAVIDDFSRSNMALVADTPLSEGRVARAQTILVECYGKPLTIVRDNGTSFTSHHITSTSSHKKRELSLLSGYKKGHVIPN